MILIQPDIVKSSLLSWAQEEFTVHWGKRALFPGEICTYQSRKWKAGTKLSGKHPKSTPAAPLVTCPSNSLCCMSNMPQRNSFGNKSLPAAVPCLMVASACKRFDMSVSLVHRGLCQAAKCLCKKPPMANALPREASPKQEFTHSTNDEIRNFGGIAI